MLSTWPKDGHRLSVSCTPLHLCSHSLFFPDPDRLLDLPGFPMSFSFQNFGTWPIYDMIFFRYMICYGRLVHFCCPAVSVWPCDRSVANRFILLLFCVPLVSSRNFCQSLKESIWIRKNPTAWTEMEGRTAYRQFMTVFWSRAQHHVTTSLMKRRWRAKRRN